MSAKHYPRLDISISYTDTITILEISMSHTLLIRAFFFNAKTDYLPYYKNFTITLDAQATTKDLLLEIKKANENFCFASENLVFKINGLVIEGGVLIETVVKRLGTSLQIDPVNSYRSNNGLIINDDDFMQSFKLLEPYASQEDLDYYKSLYPLHYASQTETFSRAFIGDAILVLAHKMIEEGSEHSEAILEAICSVESGLFDCEYENNLFEPQEHSEAIHSLKALAKPTPAPSLCSKIMARFFKTKSEDDVLMVERRFVTIENLEEKQIGHYRGKSTKSDVATFISKSKLKTVDFASATKLCGVGIFEDSKHLALKKAGSILLDAYDAGVEVLILEDFDAFILFSDNFRAIEKTMGRELIGLELICAKDFMAQLNKLAL